jgi:hypothetical protein
MGDAEQDTDGHEKVAEAIAEQRKAFTVDLIASLGDTVPKRWVKVNEWRVVAPDGEVRSDGSVCVWGTTLAQTKAIEQDVRLAQGKDPGEAMSRRIIATIIECAHAGEEPDAPLLFTRAAHWGWLAKQPTTVLDALFGAVQELDMASGVKMENILDFFAMTGSLRDCLQRIASRCDACTDCPANSQVTCPQQALTLASSRTTS